MEIISEANYYRIIENSYDKAFSHYKEQDQLRNTAFGFFTTLTVAIFGLIGKNNFNIDAGALFVFYIFMFILGLLFGVCVCRYRFYANLYSVTMKICRRLLISPIMSSDYIENMIIEEKKKIEFAYISTDYILFILLNLINCLNFVSALFICNDLFINANEYYLIAPIIIFVILYLILCYVIYYRLVIKSVNDAKLRRFYFLDMFVVHGDKY